MNTDIYRGDLVRLAAIDPEESAAAISRFSHDSEYFRLMDSYPCRLFTKEGTKKWIEKELENEHVIVFRHPYPRRRSPDRRRWPGRLVLEPRGHFPRDRCWRP